MQRKISAWKNLNYAMELAMHLDQSEIVAMLNDLSFVSAPIVESSSNNCESKDESKVQPAIACPAPPAASSESSIATQLATLPIKTPPSLLYQFVEAVDKQDEATLLITFKAMVKLYELHALLLETLEFIPETYITGYATIPHEHDLNATILYHGDNRTALGISAEKGNVKALRMLLECRFVPEDRLDTKKWKPLHFAACYGQAEATRILLEAMVNIEARNPSGFTALMIALEKGHEEVVRQLSLANVNVNDGNEFSAMHCLLYGEKNRSEFKVLRLLQALFEPNKIPLAVESKQETVSQDDTYCRIAAVGSCIIKALDLFADVMDDAESKPQEISNAKLASEYMLRLALLMDSQTQYKIAEWFGREKNLQQAFVWCERAATNEKNPCEDAWMALAAHYSNGDGVAKDLNAAKKWYEKVLAEATDQQLKEECSAELQDLLLLLNANSSNQSALSPQARM